MLAIRMRFLAGRFHATPWGHHVNEGAAEFPPSNWRLLRSLVASFYRASASRAHDEAESAEKLKTIVAALASEAPQFSLPNAAVAHTRHYDQASGGIKFFDTFVAVNPNDDILWLWRNAELGESERALLASLLENLGTFGRAESWCEAELLSRPQAEKIARENEFNGLPFVGGESLAGKETVRLLAPKNVGIDELMKSLKLDTGEMRGKNKQLEPEAAQWTTYTRPANILTARGVSKSAFAQHKKPTVARFALSASVLPLVTATLPFAELVRRALIKHRSGSEHSEIITGKSSDGTPLKNHEHAHYLPTDEDGDGQIDHLTVFAPRGFDRADVAALGRLRAVNWRESRDGIGLVLVGLGDAANFAAGETAVSPFAKSAVFRSVTPFCLPYFASRGAGKPARAKDKPEGQLRRELRVRGLPEPSEVKQITGFFETLSPIPEIEMATPRFRWLEFVQRRFNGAAGNGSAGFEIRFAAEDAARINQPLALGFGCHFGLGLFLPVE